MSLLTNEFVVAVHNEILNQIGVGLKGVNEDRLDSVLGRVHQQLYYRDITNIFEVAAWYGVCIAKGHAFNDCNKRTGLAIMLSYLNLQGVTLKTDNLDDMMVDIVTCEIDDESLIKGVALMLCDLIN